MAKIFHIALVAMVMLSCSGQPKGAVSVGIAACVWPEIDGVWCPPNIAFPNFYITDSTASVFWVDIIGHDHQQISLKTNGLVRVPLPQWQAFVEANKGQTITIRIHRKRGGIKETHPDLQLHIAEEPIDRYLWYRLIDPTLDTWYEMGIYQYDLQTLSQREILSTRHTGHGTSCMNCHHFANHDADRMQLHLRKNPRGTLVLRNDTLLFINSRTPFSRGLYCYPSWHPQGNHIAFSINDVYASYSTAPHQLTHVYDLQSGLGVMNLAQETFVTNKLLSDSNYLVSFPWFDPSGEYLYFCRAKMSDYDPHEAIHTLVFNTFYDIVRIRFDAQTDQLGSTLEPVVSLGSGNGSALFPRSSPDGRYILYTGVKFGGFSLWHKDADLWLFDTQTRVNRRLDEINSDYAESYHSWSSNGRWVVFSSRRINGLYTRPYLTYFQEDGTFGKPLLLPQKDPCFYHTFTKSYNIPEFTKNAFSKSPQELLQAAQHPATPVKTIIQ